MTEGKASGGGAVITFVVAMSENRVIGVDNGLPWRLPADLRHFKTITMGKPVLMGRRTFDSIGRALPGRRNMVVSRTPGFKAPGCEVVGSIDEALASVAQEPEVMVIGGASFYEQLLPRADRIHLTRVHTTLEGDAFFPSVNLEQWREVSREEHGADDRNQFSYSFLTYERR